MPDEGSGPAAAAGGRPGSQCRHFSLADAMVLTGALGLALGYLRMVAPGMVHSYSYLGFRPALPRAYILWMWIGPVFLSAGSLAFLVLRLLPPRPARHRIARQPGLIASVSVTVAVAVVTAFELAKMASHHALAGINSLGAFFAEYSGFVVLGSWLTLILGGRWRREPGWIDLGGTMIGFGWLVTWLVQWVWIAFLV
jgi:hypothetical protein